MDGQRKCCEKLKRAIEGTREIVEERETERWREKTNDKDREGGRERERERVECRMGACGSVSSSRPPPSLRSWISCRGWGWAPVETGEG